MEHHVAQEEAERNRAFGLLTGGYSSEAERIPFVALRAVVEEGEFVAPRGSGALELVEISWESLLLGSSSLVGEEQLPA
jgi:hypothetical protein